MVVPLITFPTGAQPPRGQSRPKNLLFKPSNLPKEMNTPVIPAITDLQYQTPACTGYPKQHNPIIGINALKDSPLILLGHTYLSEQNFQTTNIL